MIPALFYGAGCFAVAAILTIIVAMFKPIQSRDDWKSWRTFVFMYLIALAAPYIWSEGLTLRYGSTMAKSIEGVLYDASIDGKLEYYKVIWFRDGKARVMAVATEQASWGGTDRPLVGMTLIKNGDKWALDSYRVIRSDERNEDGFSFPPFF
jgi:hypothetical protein